MTRTVCGMSCQIKPTKRMSLEEPRRSKEGKNFTLEENFQEKKKKSQYLCSREEGVVTSSK